MVGVFTQISLSPCTALKDEKIGVFEMQTRETHRSFRHQWVPTKGVAAQVSN